MDDDERTLTLLGRLDAIGASLAHTDHALALIGLGSVGTELDRLDVHSDLDFFVIVDDGYKQPFIADLTWLAQASPIAFSFQNTQDGHKVFFTDGIYGEFAVFDRTELANIPIIGGRVVWQAEGTTLAHANVPEPATALADRTQWLLGEILTNLYVGLTRLHRGESLSAQRLIQGHAVDRILELCAYIEQSSTGHEDPFDTARRFETRFPETAQRLPYFIQGYRHSAESAIAILEFLDSHFSLHGILKQRVLETARAAKAQSEA